MLKNHINKLLLKNLDFEPTGDQRVLIENLAEFIVQKVDFSSFLIKGYAGTGKTTLVRSIIQTLDELKIKSVMMAPTGRATKVLSSYTGRNAFTIHKKIYRQLSAGDVFSRFVLDKNFSRNTFFIVDEASMIGKGRGDDTFFGTGNLLEDLIEFVYSGNNCRLVLIGDTAQLPPIHTIISPALSRKILESFGLAVQEVYLKEVLRQSSRSGILANATSLRLLIDNNKIEMPRLQADDQYDDIDRVNGAELLEAIQDAYDHDGVEQTIILCRSNKRANKYNEAIRNRILWREEALSVGDLLMVVKNNYFWTGEVEDMDFIANGDIIEVMKIRGYQDLYGFRFADVTVRFPDHGDIELDVKILLDTLTSNSASLSPEENQKLFYNVMEDYGEEKTKKKKYAKVRQNEWFNAMQVKFSYAVTCHKAQGGQWEVVFVDLGYFNEDMVNVEFLRWLYTAFTRAVKKLYLVNFPNVFFDLDPKT
jgi:exodeoxyribonuclease-5